MGAVAATLGGVTILIASSRQGDPADPGLWADLALCLESCRVYAPGHDVVCGWKGPRPPDVLAPNPRLRLVPQPDGAATFGAAFEALWRTAPGDTFVVLNDDTVLMPDTLALLLDDAALLDRAKHRWGFLGCRSNYVKGPQNIRFPNESALRGVRFESEAKILAVPSIALVAAAVRREALERIGGFPDVNWYSDDLMSWDLARAGYTHFVSRAYVHHVGMRSTGQGRSMQDLDREGRAWILEHRPDFAQAVGL